MKRVLKITWMLLGLIFIKGLEFVPMMGSLGEPLDEKKIRQDYQEYLKALGCEGDELDKETNKRLAHGRTEFDDYKAFFYELNGDESDVICVNIGGAGFANQEVAPFLVDIAKNHGKKVKILLISSSIFNIGTNNEPLFCKNVDEWEKVEGTDNNLTTERYRYKKGGVMEVVILSFPVPQKLLGSSVPGVDDPRFMVFNDFFESFLAYKLEDANQVFIENFTGNPDNMLPDTFKSFYKMKLNHPNGRFLTMLGVVGYYHIRSNETVQYSFESCFRKKV